LVGSFNLVLEIGFFVGGFGGGVIPLSNAGIENEGISWFILSSIILVPYSFPEHQIRDDNFFILQAFFLLV
jgi:hypothetical protein